jgi:hypothetical protein
LPEILFEVALPSRRRNRGAVTGATQSWIIYHLPFLRDKLPQDQRSVGLQ